MAETYFGCCRNAQTRKTFVLRYLSWYLRSAFFVKT